LWLPVFRKLQLRSSGTVEQPTQARMVELRNGMAANLYTIDLITASQPSSQRAQRYQQQCQQ